MHVKPKKHLGQHFLADQIIAKKIADTLSGKGYQNVLEVGPGTGVLTTYLLQKPFNTWVIELDVESVRYLESNFAKLQKRIIPADFLKWDAATVFSNQPFAVIGNYPYNISSQIVFKVIDLRAQIPEMSGMFQREMARRICSEPGSKEYGIISVLAQAYYTCTYLFTVSEEVFIPPPKVKSGVIHLQRRPNLQLDCDEKLFKQIVKSTFGQRRKTLRNGLKPLSLPLSAVPDEILAKRPEQLHWQEFVELTKMLQNHVV